MNSFPQTPFDSEKHYRQLFEKSKEVLEFTFQSELKDLQGTSHSFISDFELWSKVLNSSSRLEVKILQSALREYQFGLYALALGMYRQAFMALRLFLELGLGSIYLSTLGVDLRLWMQGSRDNNWGEIMDFDKGIFSHRFTRAYFVEIKDEAPEYIDRAKTVYRDCSEYVHGNIRTHEQLPDALRFSEITFQDWHNKAGEIHQILIFALCLRYLKELDAAQLNKLEHVVMDELGHISAIRGIFGGVQGV